MPLPSTALLAIAGAASLAIACEGTPRRRAYYLLKPATTLLIIGVLLTLPDSSAGYRLRALVAMLACLVGDIALLGYRECSFTLGLGVFLLGHLLFIAALLYGVAAPALPWWSLLAPVYAAAGVVVLWPRAGAMRGPVLVYIAAILAMWLAAAARWQTLGGHSALLALAGASVFIASDSLLAWQRFVGPYRGADAAVLSTYWLAMTLLALSAAGSLRP